MGQNFLFAVIWGVIFFSLGTWLVSIDFWLSTILAYICYALCGMCIFSLFAGK